MLLIVICLNQSNILTVKHIQTWEWYKPVCRVPATVKHIGRGVGLLQVWIKRQCHWP